MLPELITFDWDGTLADTRPAVVASLENTLSSYGHEPWDITKRKYRDTDKSLKENFPNFFGPDAAKAYQKYLNTYIDQHLPKIQKNELYDEIFRYLTDHSILIGIISNKEQKLLDIEVNQLFPDARFKFIFGNGATQGNKPAPSPIITMANKCNIEINPTNIWHVGDSKQDTDAAIAANVKAILIGDGKFFDDLDGHQGKITQLEIASNLFRYLKEKKLDG